VSEDLSSAHAALEDALLRLRNRDGAWPYYAGKRSRVEPTCWATLATGVRLDTTPLAGWLGHDGFVTEPGVSGNHAFAALAGLTIHTQDTVLSGRVSAALTAVFGTVIPASPVIRQDPNLRGWGWTPDTFSWVEPTAWCMLALKKGTSSAAVRARTDEGERVLRDRVCAGGGWNFGNSDVYGQDLPAHVPPTAICVMALQDRVSDAVVDDAVSFLERHAPIEGSTTALALSVLALATVGRSTAALATRLAAHVPQAIAFGNVAALGMAAYALQCAIPQRRPPAFALEVPGR
jgi:hypothetical protein